MFSAFQTFGKLGAIGKAIAAAWSPLSLWPDGIATPGMWISPRDLTSQWQDYQGTTPVVPPGTVADSSNPVGLALDIRAGATALADPGNHMLQATSAARPLLSGRVNQIVSTDDLTGTGWAGGGGANTPTTLVDTRWQVSSIVGRAYQVVTMQFEAMAVSTATGVIARIDRDYVAQGNEQTFAINSASWTLITKTATLDNGTNPPVFRIDVDGTGAVYIRHCQIESGAVATAYQQVNAASDYSSTGITPFQLYDGIDDGMATASFAAGTLINGMDCMIAVRRDSAAACVAGLYNGIADATKFFGMAESASGSGCVGSGAGTPTVWVDGVQLSGGTAVTRGTLHTALTVGDYHIVEFKNLDLSTWTAAGFGLYTSYVFPGPRGDILLYPSTASTEDKDAARQYLADYYGVTLP